MIRIYEARDIDDQCQRIVLSFIGNQKFSYCEWVVNGCRRLSGNCIAAIFKELLCYVLYPCGNCYFIVVIVKLFYAYFMSRQTLVVVWVEMWKKSREIFSFNFSWNISTKIHLKKLIFLLFVRLCN